MKLKHKLIVAYVFIGIVYGLYSWLFGDTAHRSLAYNFGYGFAWPFVMFPAVGDFLRGIVVVAVVLALFFLS